MKLHEHFFQGLQFRPIQLDELWANVRQESQAARRWVALETTTKIVPVIRLGPRTLELTYAVVHELRQRMQSGCRCQFLAAMGCGSTFMR